MLHRYSHAVRPVKGDRQPTRWIALGVETTTVPYGRSKEKRIRKLSKWCMSSWTCERGKAGKVREQRGRSVQSLWDALLAPLQMAGPTWLVCCPAVQVCSLCGLWERLDSGELRWGEDDDEDTGRGGHKGPRGACGQPILEDVPTSLSVRARGYPGTLCIADVRNWGLGEVATGATARQSSAHTGCALRSVVCVLSERGLGSLQPTAGSQAWYSFRRRFLHDKLHVHCRMPVLRLERNALAGGRCEAYRLGRVDGPVFQVDFSSCYCSILRDCALPVRLRYSGDCDSPLLRSEIADGRGVIAQSRVSTDWPHLPYRRDGLVIYPTGRFWAVLAGPDLHAALAAREVSAIGEWATYDLDRTFSPFARELLAIRQAARLSQDVAVEQWAKAMGVSLVGKLCQRGRHWEDTGKTVHRPWCVCPGDGVRQGDTCRDCHLPLGWGQWTYRGADGVSVPMRALSGRLQRRVDHGETRDSCPAISAYVYAHGRRKLWEAQLVAGRDEVYYCCVDSLFVSRTGYERLQVSGLLGSGQPGALRLVAVHDWMEIFGVNYYRVPGRDVGVSPLLPGLGGQASPGNDWRPRTARESIGAGRAPLPVEVCERIVRLSPYRHGVRESDGRVSPWRVET